MLISNFYAEIMLNLRFYDLSRLNSVVLKIYDECFIIFVIYSLHSFYSRSRKVVLYYSPLTRLERETSYSIHIHNYFVS